MGRKSTVVRHCTRGCWTAGSGAVGQRGQGLLDSGARGCWTAGPGAVGQQGQGLLDSGVRELLRTLSEGDCVRGVRAASLAAGGGVSPEDSLRDSSCGGQQQ